MTDASRRLQRLEHILARWTTGSIPTGEASADPLQLHLGSVPLDRIRELSAELQQRADQDSDEVDAVIVRLLLNDYAAAVAHLRAVARATEGRLSAGAGGIAESREFVRREQELAAKRAARFTAPDATE